MPFVIAGGCGICVGLVVMYLSYLAHSFALFTIGWLLTSVMSNISSSPYQAIIPDLVRKEQLGIASGFMGFMYVIDFRCN